jgi:hypothetical protein
MDCPKCGLINPDTAELCDCGYGFKTGTVETLNHHRAGSRGPGEQLRYFLQGERSRRPSVSRDFAYLCFAWIAIAYCATALVSILPLSADAHEALGMIIGFYVMGSAIVAAIVGIILSLVNWREWPLWVTSAIVVPLVFLAGDEWSPVDASVVVLIFFCIRWFGLPGMKSARNRSMNVQAD